MTDEYSKRRRYPRIPSLNTVLVRSSGDADLEEFARTRTLGLGGCSFLSPAKIGLGEFLEILISVERQVARATARVVYENEAEQGRCEVGVEFIEISDEDRELIRVLFAPADDAGELKPQPW